MIKPEALGRTDSSITKWRVLVFPGGTEIGLEIRQALAMCKEVQLFSAGADVSNHAPFAFARHFTTPLVGTFGWLEALSEIVTANNISHIFPAHDDALVELAENAAQLGAKVVTSPLETCRITRSKTATLKSLNSIVPTPKLFSSEEEVIEFPVFLKPDKGQGAQRTDCAHDKDDLKWHLRRDPKRIIMELLPGREFTVDCFSDRRRGLLYVGGRERRRIRAGIAMDSVFAKEPQLNDYALQINKTLIFHGAWFFQVKEDRNGLLKLMEVAPRVGGTSALSRARGVNLPLLSLYESDGEVLSVSVGNHEIEMDRALVNRYRSDLSYSTLYIDFDDTLIIRGRVNCELLKLLYQALNRKVQLVLLSRHSGDLGAALQRYRLENLFDKVIHLQRGESKSDFIVEKQAVLIDDSFSERTEVHSRVGIPVFDPSMIEVLFDERV